MKNWISHEDLDVYMVTEKDSPKSAASLDARLMSFGIMDTYGNDRRLACCDSIYDMGDFKWLIWNIYSTKLKGKL